MWLKALIVLVAAAIVAVPAFSLADRGGGPKSGGPTRGSDPSGWVVNPRTGGPSTPFTFRFRAPDASGAVSATTRLSYLLSVLGPSRPGCLVARSSPVPDVTKGMEASVTLDPAKLGGSWCPGNFQAQVAELQTPVCPPATMCAQFVRVVGVVARTEFRVTAPGPRAPESFTNTARAQVVAGRGLRGSRSRTRIKRSGSTSRAKIAQ